SRTTTKTAAVPITHLRIGGDLEEPDQLPSLRTHGKRTPVELADRLDAEHRVRHEELVACRELGRREVGLVGREPYPLRMLEHDAPHHAADAAACDARRHQRVAAYAEHVAREAADDITARAPHKTFLRRRAVDLHLREHLLQSAQMLETRKLRILPEPQRAGPQNDAASV